MRTQNTNSTLAQVKGSHLIVESLGNEVVVFDRRVNKAHILDPRAAAIWRAAENGCSLDDVALLMEATTADERRKIAQIAVADLASAGLVTSDVQALPRRQALRTLGRVAALPMVISILAPTPAAAASNLFPGGFCTQGTDTCQTPITVMSTSYTFLCQDPTAMGVNQGRCCRDEPTRTDVRQEVGTVDMACASNLQCCSLDCDTVTTMTCMAEF